MYVETDVVDVVLFLRTVIVVLVLLLVVVVVVVVLPEDAPLEGTTGAS